MSCHPKLCMSFLTESSLSFGVGSGVLIAVPIPADASCLGEDIDLVIQQALADAK